MVTRVPASRGSKVNSIVVSMPNTVPLTVWCRGGSCAVTLVFFAAVAWVADPSHPEHIITEPGVGYRFEA